MSAVFVGERRGVWTRWLGWALLPFLIGCADKRPALVGSARAEAPVVMLVALDGFHPNYLDWGPSRHLRRLAQEGVRARWLVPVFPTLTFPNLYSVATGLYPEHHGIVSNTIRDSVLGNFTLRDTGAVRNPRWWGGEPIWVTAVRQGKRAATYFWPGSEASIGGVRPTYSKLYDPSVPNLERVRQVLEWLSLAPGQAPALVTLYLGDVDQAGHQFGPNSPEMDAAIARVDNAVGELVSGLQARGLAGRVNLVIVSDHGMSELKPSQLIYLDDYIDTAAVDLVDLGPLVSLATRSGAGEEEVYRRLLRVHPHLTVYRKPEVPARYHYRASPRIQPIIGVADEGWMVTTRGVESRRGRQRLPRGVHGYPPEVPAMRALFLASGPAFRKGAVVEPFQNVHIYPLLAHILQLRAAPTDGSLDSVTSLLVAGGHRGGP